MPAGRPSSFTEKIADSICEQISEGASLIQVTKKAGMPSMATVMRWLGDKPDFESKYARAREAQAEVMDDKILTVANKTTNKNALANRVRIDAYKWRAAKLAPKKYGDKQQVEHSGNLSLAQLVAASNKVPNG